MYTHIYIAAIVSLLTSQLMQLHMNYLTHHFSYMLHLLESKAYRELNLVRALDENMFLLLLFFFSTGPDSCFIIQLTAIII